MGTACGPRGTAEKGLSRVLTVIRAVGKPRPKELQSLLEDYRRRCRGRLEMEIHWHRSKRDLWSRSGAQRIVLDPTGWAPSSDELAKFIGERQEAGIQQLDFLIGDADGFTEDERRDASKVISLSRLVFPHRLAALVLAEQLYRSGTILAGHPYHRE